MALFNLSKNLIKTFEDFDTKQLFLLWNIPITIVHK